MPASQKRLTLLRHAKSSWSDPNLDDIDRPLNKRGRRLAARGARPSLILTSPAVRARKTARVIAEELSYPREFLQREDALYLASPDEIIAVVAAQDPGFNDVLVVGHNPGLTDLANRLTGERIDNVPTCGIVAVDLEIGDWDQLIETRGELAFFDFPKMRVDQD